jgi:basic membrane lipoprotein Med (substrate-binding protein (PBP1-ABC) superfamily)
VTTQQIIDETEGQDLDKLLTEGPALFVAEQDTAALADAGVTREMALSHVVSKTAGFTGPEITEYRTKFLAGVEAARRDELVDRKATTKKEAAAEQDVLDNVPDEALFG